MLDQITFDRSEDIAEALHEQKWLSRNLLNVVYTLPISEDQRELVFALIHAQDHCRNRAVMLTGDITRSGAERGPDG